MISIVLAQLSDSARDEENVRINAEDRVAVRVREDQISYRHAHNARGPEVACTGHALDKLPRVIAAVVVDDQHFRVGEVLVEPQGLDGEIHTIEVVVGGHPNRQRHQTSTSRG
jgi:hypothetical protein